MVQAAYQAGLQGLAFTEHLEWMPDDEARGFLNFDTYFRELDGLRAEWQGRLEVLAGLEMGNPHRFPAQAAAVLAARPWDYVLGSVHWSDGYPGWLPLAFEAGLETAYRRYFEELYLLARDGEYDILAHFDLVRRDSWNLYHQTLPVEAFADPIHATLESVVARGKGLEINTSALAAGLAEPCPSWYILQQYRALGGEILVFGSDAHSARRVAQHFEQARQMALAAGFTRLAQFRQRQIVGWIPL